MRNSFFIIAISFFAAFANAQAQSTIPRLVKNGITTQSLVDNRPFLILGGELGNSSASGNDYMRPIWQKLKQLNLNTAITPVYWELMEPVEGQFDFSLVDSLIKNARLFNMKLVLLWFGAWKNSMSCYAPAWVKIGDFLFTVHHEYKMGWSAGAKEYSWPLAGGLIISVSPNEIYIAGTGIVMTFAPKENHKKAGFLSVDEGRFVRMDTSGENGIWKPGRRLNGDQDHQGRHVRIPGNEYSIQHVKLYSY